MRINLDDADGRRALLDAIEAASRHEYRRGAVTHAGYYDIIVQPTADQTDTAGHDWHDPDSREVAYRGIDAHAALAALRAAIQDSGMGGVRYVEVRVHDRVIASSDRHGDVRLSA